ncbi:MAG: IS66 family transposase, partial [Acidobacteria bacterium]|nr:IS66 family transposase [Acidobacteriota bacterium]
MQHKLPQPKLSDTERIEQLEKQLAWAQLKIQVLEERLRLQRIAKYGPASEKLSSAQLELLELEPGVSEVEVQAEIERGQLTESTPANNRQRRKHPGRQELPAGLPRVEQVIACTPEQCSCKACGQPTEVIGYDQSEQLDVEPAKYFVKVIRREKRACKHCRQGGVAAAAMPARIIEKSLVSDRVVIDTVVAKYSDHLPLYRQSAMMKRETGIELSRATLDGWVMRVGESLTPVVMLIGHELVDEGYIQADETPVEVQMHDRRGANHQAYLWQYSRPGASVVFDFRLGRGREGPRKFLSTFKGILQTDGYAAYEGVGAPGMVHACCWSHARRYFIDALKLAPADVATAAIVRRMDELFAVDAEARSRSLDLSQRHALRQERSRPLLDSLKSQIEAAGTQALPSSAAGKAVRYTLGLWPKLTRFLDYPELELSRACPTGGPAVQSAGGWGFHGFVAASKTWRFCLNGGKRGVMIFHAPR